MGSECLMRGLSFFLYHIYGRNPFWNPCLHVLPRRGISLWTGALARGLRGRPARTLMAALWGPASVVPAPATAQPLSVVAGSARAPAWRSPTVPGASPRLWAPLGINCFPSVWIRWFPLIPGNNIIKAAELLLFEDCGNWLCCFMRTGLSSVVLVPL